MPDKAGAFLKASKIISKLGGNIVRVNYNKALDLHTLFVEVSASTAAHKKIQKELEKCNYLFDETENQKILFEKRGNTRNRCRKIRFMFWSCSN